MSYIFYCRVPSWKTVTANFISNIKLQASAYEACDRTRTTPRTPKTLETCKKKARLVGLRKLQGVRQMARLKQQRSLSFTFCETRKSCDLTTKSCVFICYFIDSVVKIVLSETATGGVLYKKVFLKFKKIHRKTQGQNLFFNKFAGAADVFTYHLNLKIFEHTL